MINAGGRGVYYFKLIYTAVTIKNKYRNSEAKFWMTKGDKKR